METDIQPGTTKASSPQGRGSAQKLRRNNKSLDGSTVVPVNSALTDAQLLGKWRDQLGNNESTTVAWAQQTSQVDSKMASAYQTTHSSARDTKLATKRVSLNADLDPYDSKARRPQKKVTCRLANPAYKNLTNDQRAAFTGFKLGLFDSKSTIKDSSAGAASVGKPRARSKKTTAGQDAASSQTMIEKYYSLVKGGHLGADDDYGGTLTTQQQGKHRNLNSLSSQAAAAQTLSPRLNESFYLRREGGVQSPPQPISKRMPSNFALRNRYDPTADSAQMYLAAPQASGIDRARTIRSSLDENATGRGGQWLKKGGMRVEINGLNEAPEQTAMGMKSAEALKASSRRQQETRFAQNDRLGRVKSAASKHPMLSDNSERQHMEAYQSQEKQTNASSAKSIRVLRAIQRMSVDPVPFHEAKKPVHELKKTDEESGGRSDKRLGYDRKTRGFGSSLTLNRPRPTRPYSSSTQAVKCSTLAHRRRAAEVAKSTVFVNGFVEPIAYRVKPSNNQGSIRVQDLLRGEFSDAVEQDMVEQMQEGAVDSRRLGSSRGGGPSAAKHQHARTTTNLHQPGQDHNIGQASAFRSPEAVQERLTKYVGQLEPKFVSFQARNVVCAQRLPIHKGAEGSAIINAVSTSSPPLYKQSFRADANVAPTQHFLAEAGGTNDRQQQQHPHEAGTPPEKLEAMGLTDLPQYKVTSMPNFNMKDKGTAEAEERDEMIKENEAYIRQQRVKREKKGRLEKIKRDIQILESDQRLGMINMQKVIELTRVPLAEGAERPRPPGDAENFMELKNFCNKYREKLFRKSDIQQTMVDKLFNRNAGAARQDKIDFDLPHFRLFCLEGNKGAKFDNRHVLRQRQALTRPDLYARFLRRRPVEARKNLLTKNALGEWMIKEKPTELRGADDLLAPEYSTIPRSAQVRLQPAAKERPKKVARSEGTVSDDEGLFDEESPEEDESEAQEDEDEAANGTSKAELSDKDIMKWEESMMKKKKLEAWEKLENFMRFYCPELFYTEMSPMYNNPEVRPGVLDQAAGDSASQAGSGDPEQDATKAEEEEPAAGRPSVLAALLGASREEPATKQVVVEVSYDPDYDKAPRVVENRETAGAGTQAGGKKSRKNNWDEGGQPVSAKAKRFDQFYQARVKAAAGSIEPQLLKQRQRKERIKKQHIEVDVGPDRAAAADGDKKVKHRFDCVTVDYGTQMAQLTAAQRRERSEAPEAGQGQNEREQNGPEPSPETTQGGAEHKGRQTKQLEKREQAEQNQDQHESEAPPTAEQLHLAKREQLLHGPERRRAQVYAQVADLKRQALRSAYMVDQEAQADIKLADELEAEKREREYQVSRQVEQKKAQGGPGSADPPAAGTSGAPVKAEDAAASSATGKDQKKAASQAERTAQPKKQVKSFMQPIGQRTRARVRKEVLNKAKVMKMKVPQRNDELGFKKLKSEIEEKEMRSSANLGARTGSTASHQQSKKAASSTVDAYLKYELPGRQSEAKEARKFLGQMTSKKAKEALSRTREHINQQFDEIHLKTQEMLNVQGPEHKELLEHMEQALNYNLDVTQQQYANARRGLMEERIKFWKKFKNDEYVLEKMQSIFDKNKARYVEKKDVEDECGTKVPKMPQQHINEALIKLEEDGQIVSVKGDEYYGPYVIKAASAK